MAQRRAKEIDDAVAKAGERVSLALGSAGVAAIYFGKQLIDGIDALNDVSDATGATVEKISALEDIGLRTGTSLDTVSGILTKFNGALKEADGKNGVSLALKAIGLDVAELRKLDPAEALRVTAAALATYADDGDKARMVQELFGKSVKETAPFLKDLAEQTQLVGKVSAEEAAQAEAFNKQIFALQKYAIDAGRALLKDLLPAVNEILQAMSNGGVMSALDKFGERAFGWTSNAQSKRIESLRKELGALNDEAAAIKFDVFGSKAGIAKDIEAKTAELRSAEKAFLNLKDKSYEAQGGINPKPPEEKPSVGTLPTPKAGGKSPRESELQRYIENLQKQLQTTQELSAAETVLADIQSGRLKLAKGESADRAVALARDLDAAKARAAQQKADMEGANARHDALLKDAKTQEDQVRSLAESNKSLEQEIQLIGKSAEAIAAIEKARNSSNIALKEEQLARMTNGDYMSREAAALEEQIRLLRERGALIDKKGIAEKAAEDAKATEQLASSLGSSFESAFEKIATDGGKASDVLRALLADTAKIVLRLTVTKPLIDTLTKSISGGGAKGDGAGGGGFDLGKMMGSFGGWLSGLMKFADGGDPPVGRASIVGERGAELFVPRTAGTIIPNHALGRAGGGGWGAPVINNYGSSKVSVTRRPDGRPEIAIREMEAALADPNSRVSKSLQRNYNLQRSR
ncbi:hypothetical protein [Variovorax sp. EBFNA2]|uniref:hypothetical protein n=1 Tax=Variovorax sp. EBFNA2 TaxID=3342097 RepID=UPI0029C0D42B|nr:hypothetical protein [Variovorax boronicumulans]WPG35130.1 hypothetical protein RZE79_16695 [Variovorax boronicumulans]